MWGLAQSPRGVGRSYIGNKGWNYVSHGGALFPLPPVEIRLTRNHITLQSHHSIMYVQLNDGILKPYLPPFLI